MAYAADLKSAAARLVGSSPTTPTRQNRSITKKNLARRVPNRAKQLKKLSIDTQFKAEFTSKPHRIKRYIPTFDAPLCDLFIHVRGAALMGRKAVGEAFDISLIDWPLLCSVMIVCWLLGPNHSFHLQTVNFQCLKIVIDVAHFSAGYLLSSGSVLD